jgi:hypothetical protein
LLQAKDSFLPKIAEVEANEYRNPASATDQHEQGLGIHARLPRAILNMGIRYLRVPICALDSPQHQSCYADVCFLGQPRSRQIELAKSDPTVQMSIYTPLKKKSIITRTLMTRTITSERSAIYRTEANSNNSQDTSMPCTRLARIQLIQDLNTTYLVNICPLQSLVSYIDEDLSKYNSPEYFELEVMPRWWCIPHLISCLINTAGLDPDDLDERIGLDHLMRSIMDDAVARKAASAVNTPKDADNNQSGTGTLNLAAVESEQNSVAVSLNFPLFLSLTFSFTLHTIIAHSHPPFVFLFFLHARRNHSTVCSWQQVQRIYLCVCLSHSHRRYPLLTFQGHRLQDRTLNTLDRKPQQSNQVP